MPTHNALRLSRLLAAGVVLAACGGSATTPGAVDAASSGFPEDGASIDAGTGGPDSVGPPSDASPGGDALEAAASGSDGAMEVGTSNVQCSSAGSRSFPTFDKACSKDTDCVLVVHTLSCCGDVFVMAINKGALSAFQAAESTCNSQYPACGCASNAVTFESGVAYGGTSDPTRAAAASCVANSCLATFTGPTFACGNKVCAAGVDYCEIQASTDGAPPTDQCVFLGLSTGDAGITCSSFAVAPGCACSESQGNPIVTCP